MSDKRRLGAFSYYDKDGILGNFREYLLEKMAEHTDKMVMVCNGYIKPEEREKALEFVEDIFVRENEGYDAGGWKDLFLEFLKPDELSGYDEVILFNDSFFGPVHPLDDMFDKMDSREGLDFWGVTMHGKNMDPWGKIEYGYIPTHIQSYFIGIRKRLACSGDFIEYWEEMPDTVNLTEAIARFECTFTKHFEDIGYKWDVYVDCSDMISDDLDNTNLNHYYAYKLISERKCPFVKRKTFYNEVMTRLEFEDISEPQNCYDFIKNETDYPAEYIYEQLIRTVNIRALYEAFHLDYILPTECRSDSENVADLHKTALIMHLYYPDLFEYCRNYAMSMPESADIYITTSRSDYIDEIREIFIDVKCRKLEIITVENRGRDMAGLLVGAGNFICDYEYVCFIHDKKSPGAITAETGRVFCKTLFESLLASPDYVSNVLELFEKHEHLGILCPSVPYAGNYFGAYVDSWAFGTNISNTMYLADSLNLNCNISPDMPPLTIGTAFWCRTESLKKLFARNWTYSDFPTSLNVDGTISHAIERIFGYVAQDAGYYTAAVYPTDFAGQVLSNMSLMLRKTAGTAKTLPAFSGATFLSLIGSLNTSAKVMRKNQRKLRKIQKSKSTKIGKAITVLPRTVKKSLHRIKKQRNKKHPTKRILLISHEMSMTGVPLVLMNMAKVLRNGGYYVKVVSDKMGPMYSEMIRQGIRTECVYGVARDEVCKKTADEFDLVIVNTIASAFAIDALKDTGVPVIWWIHEAKLTYDDVNLSHMPEVLPSNVHAFCVSEYAGKILESYRPEYKYSILAYGLEDISECKPAEEIEMPDKKDKTAFAIVGSLDYRKGQDIVVEAIKLMPKEAVSKALFMFAGNCADDGLLERITELEKKYPENVKYCGSLMRNEVARLYEVADCLICASRDDPMPCVIGEGFSEGIPVICSENTGYTSVIRDKGCGIIFGDDSPADLARCLENMINNPAFMKKAGKTAKKLFQDNYSMKQFRKNVLSVVRAVMSHTEKRQGGFLNEWYQKYM